MKSKYWSDMFVSGVNDNNLNNFIISYDKPIKYTDNKNITFSNILLEKNYDEFCSFINKNNQMSTGNTTLLPKSELINLLKLDHFVISLRSKSKNKLIGTIISIKLPILNRNEQHSEIIKHGCTTFLNVHKALRGHGICMALIRNLINFAYDEGIYCDYHTVPFKLGNNSVKIKSWYRPLNLEQSIKLGFLYSGYDDTQMKRRNRLKYRTILPPNHTYVKTTIDNAIVSLKLYQTLTESKKFVFYPDINLWIKWIENFPTYIIYKNNIEIGIVSINTIHCIIDNTKEEGRLALPVICAGDIKSVLPVLIHICNNIGYSVLYLYQYGDINKKSLEKVNALQNKDNSWFSLYNNKINIGEEDISVPLL